MDLSEIEILIVKYLTRSANSEELDILNIWIKKPENEEIFYEYIRIYFLIELSMDQPDGQDFKKNLLKHMQEDKRLLNRFRVFKVLKYAAIAIVFLALGYVITLTENFTNDTRQIERIIPKEDAVSIELGNGDIKVLSGSAMEETISVNGKMLGKIKNNKFVYVDSNLNVNEFNTLRVPFGKKFEISLSDGSTIYMNSGSTLRYPMLFSKEGKRKVFLSGEAFFDIVKDESRPFIVSAQEVDIEVLGTSFNVSNYTENENTQVVLVNGLVKLSSKDIKEINDNVQSLEPNHMASYDKFTKQVSTKKVNTSIYTSWMQGNVIFRGETFENITKKLERIYNVVIINNNEKLSKKRFNATIETEKESIEQVFKYFNKVYQIDYSIIENKIVIN